MGRLLHEENIHQLKYNSKFDKEALYLKPHQSGQPSYDNSRCKGPCNYCGWWGHWLKECWDQEANIRKLEVDHEFKLDQQFKSSANIILEEELTKTLNLDDVDANALFEVTIVSLDKNSNPH